MSSSLCEAVRSLLEDVCSILADVESDGQVLSGRIIQLQPAFQEIVASLAGSAFDPAVEQRLRPLQTEGHRRLKLAGIAAMRLKAAKQAKTLAEARSQVSEHLLQLQKFLEAMAEMLGDLD